METLVITVDGETFEVRESDEDGTCYYLWVGGRHQGDYGFGSKRSDGAAKSVEEHRQSIRTFLDGIDPVTGFLE